MLAEAEALFEAWEAGRVGALGGGAAAEVVAALGVHRKEQAKASMEKARAAAKQALESKKRRLNISLT